MKDEKDHINTKTDVFSQMLEHVIRDQRDLHMYRVGRSKFTVVGMQSTVYSCIIIN